MEALGGSGIVFTLRVDGVLDLETARRIRDALMRARPGDVYVIDLAETASLDETGLAVLADALTVAAASRVSLRGLQPGGRRAALRLGVDPAAIEGPLLTPSVMH
jgi:anti-anti-sigma regulatory factor